MAGLTGQAWLTGSLLGDCVWFVRFGSCCFDVAEAFSVVADTIGTGFASRTWVHDFVGEAGQGARI